MTATTPDATLVFKNPSKCPVLEPGPITPENLYAFESACQGYLETIGVEDTTSEFVEVRRIAAGLMDPRINAWYRERRALCCAMSLSNFMKEVREQFLDENWESQSRLKIANLRQSVGESFDDFQMKVRSLNAQLLGTTAFVREQELIVHLASHIHIELQHIAIDEGVEVNRDTDINDWCFAMKRLDRRYQRELLRQEGMAKRAAAKRSAAHKAERSNATPRTNSTTTTTQLSTPGTSTSTRIQLPKITDEERALFNKFEGCTKCRQFFAGHRASDCPNDWPNAQGYVTRTRAAAEAKAAKQAIKTEVTTAVFAPTGNESDSEYVHIPSTPAFAVPHLQPNIFVSGPSLEFPLRIRPLVDSGCPTVLISSKLVDKLGLKRHLLPKPEASGSAFDAEGKTSGLGFTEWVKLRVTSGDQTWTSHTIRAKVAPVLCTSLILGLLFLGQNNIVIDAQERSIIHKPTGYNLMRPSASRSHAKTTPPKLSDALAEKSPSLEKSQNLLNALSDKSETPPITPATPQEVQAEVMAAVLAKIETLATQEVLEKLDREYKEKWKDRFPADIPHTNKLPDNVFY